MNFISKHLAFIPIAALLFGCSSSDSGGGSTPPPPQTKSISGVVANTPIEGARVELFKPDGALAGFCGSTHILPCQTFSEADGSFNILVPIDEDLTGYYFATYGGIDAGYGTDLTGISFSSPLSLFDAGSESVVISPATTVVNSLVVNEGVALSTAVEYTAESLGIDESLIAAVPLENVELLKASYLVVKIAELIHNEGESEPLAKIAETIKGVPLAIAEDSFLTGLFTNSEITSGETIVSLKEEIKRLHDLLDSLPNIGDPAAFAEQILKEDIKLVFEDAVIGNIENLGSATELFKENVGLLRKKLSDLLGEGERLPTNQFAAHQLVRFIIQEDSFFGDYDNYIAVGFSTHLDDLVPTDPAEKAEFIKNIAAISRESIYFANVKLSEALGLDDNAKRVDYYFRSNIDVNYIARSLLDRVFNDDINDAIVSYAVKAYALYGMHERAYELANANIKTSLARANAFRAIGHNTAVYDPEKAERYLDDAASILDLILQTNTAQSSSINNIADAYINLSSSYSKAGCFDKSLALKEKVIDDILDMLDSETTPTRFTLHARVISSLTTKLIPELTSAGDYSEALDAAAYANRLIDAMDKGPSATNPYSPQIMYLSQLAALNRAIANVDVARVDAVKTNIQGIRDSMERYVDDPATISTQWMGYYANIAGDIYWALGETAGLQFFNKIDIDEDEDAKFDATFKIAAEIALTDGFDDAVAFIEEYNPLDDEEYSNVTSLFGWGWLDGLVYYNSSSDGIGFYAYHNGDTAIAGAAADKALEILDAAVEYYSDEYDQDDLDAELENLVTYESYALASRYIENGYLRVAKLYIALDENALAKDALDKALDFTDSTSESFLKSKAYAAIGYQYKLAGYTTDGDAAFDKADDLDAALINTDINRVNHFIGLAYDAITMQAADKVDKVKTHLASAANYADSIGLSDTTYDDEVDAFIKIAELYANIVDKEDILSSLEKAESAADSILGYSTKLAQYKKIINAYAKLGFVDAAYDKAYDLISEAADRNPAIEAIAEIVASIDDFPNSSIAFSDTDKDGKPDFFLPWATSEQITASGLELDDDIDGDGVADDSDLTPFFAD